MHASSGHDPPLHRLAHGIHTRQRWVWRPSPTQEGLALTLRLPWNTTRAEVTSVWGVRLVAQSEDVAGVVGIPLGARRA